MMPSYMQQPMPDVEMDALKRARLYAQTLREGAQKNIDQGGQMISGIYVPRDTRGDYLNQALAGGLDFFTGQSEQGLTQKRQQAEQEQFNKLAAISPTEERTYSLPEGLQGPIDTKTIVKPPQQLMAETNQVIAGFAPTSQIGQVLKQAAAAKQLAAPYEAAERMEMAEIRKQEAIQKQQDKLEQIERDAAERRITREEADARAFQAKKELAVLMQEGRASLALTLAAMKGDAKSAKLSEKAEAKEQSRASALNILDNMAENITNLETGGGLVGAKGQGVLGNIGAYVSNLPLAQEAQRAIGGSNQAERDMLESRRLQLLTELKQAKGLSASEMNSNFELQKRLEALGGGRMNVGSLKEIMDDTRQLFGGERKYGKGRASSGKVRPPTPTPNGWTSEEWNALTDEERASIGR